jgi:hypothetical protein
VCKRIQSKILKDRDHKKPEPISVNFQKKLQISKRVFFTLSEFHREFILANETLLATRTTDDIAAQFFERIS